MKWRDEVLAAIILPPMVVALIVWQLGKPLWLAILATPLLVGSIVLIAWSIEHYHIGPYRCVAGLNC